MLLRQPGTSSGGACSHRFFDGRSMFQPGRRLFLAFALIVLGIVGVGALTIWLFYGTQL